MTRPDRPRQFLDALAGADGTQALTTRYTAPPVYPDASLGVPSAASRTSSVPPVVVRIDPKVLAAIEAAAAERAAADRLELEQSVGRSAANRAAAARGPRPPRAPATVAIPYGMPAGPSRQQAASANYYQGPVPTAVGPAAAGQHNLPMSYAPQQNQVGYPQNTPRGRQPAQNAAGPALPQRQPRVAAPRRRPTSWIQGGILLVVFILIGSGLGARLLDWIRLLFER